MTGHPHPGCGPGRRCDCEGDLLAEIDPRAYRLDLEAAKARLLIAESKMQVAKIKATNTQSLLEKKVISQDELALPQQRRQRHKAHSSSRRWRYSVRC